MRNSRKKFFCLTLTIVMLTLCLAVMLCACENKTPKTVFAESLKAKPISALNNSEPKVLDSMTDGRYNYYLIDVGYIKDTYISTLASVDYTGVPIEFSKSTTSSSSYVKTLSRTVEESISFSKTDSYSVGVSIDFSFIKPSFSWTGSWTNSSTNSKSTSDTVETAKEFSESQTIKYSLGKDEEIGRYRYAIYSVCDIYFILQTSLDNKNLISCNTQVCAREEEYFVRSEFSADGTFNNSPENAIEIQEDFYQNLPKPTKLKTDEEKVASITCQKTIRTGTTTIFNRNNYVKDTVTFSFKEMTYNEMQKRGYTKISIRLDVDIKEYRTSGDLYNGIRIEDRSGEVVKEWKYKRHQGDWETYQIEVIDLNINQFYIGDDQFKMRVVYFCLESNFQDWYLGTVKLIATIY